MCVGGGWTQPVAVSRNIAAFEHALLVRVCQLVTTMLQNLLDPRCERALQESDLRVVLRIVRTIIWHFHGQLRSKCGIFIEALLSGKSLALRARLGTAACSSVAWVKTATCAGTSPECSLWQRVNVLVVLRHLSANAQITHFLFTTYDMRQVGAETSDTVR